MGGAGLVRVSVGQHSTAGRKSQNQDFLDFRIPERPTLDTKGICLAIADGISSSSVSRVASEIAVRTFLDDYYCISEALSVKTAGIRVLRAINSWLHSQTRSSEFRYELDRGYVCTLSVVVLKATTAHVLHVGDCRVVQFADGRLHALTREHREVLEDGHECLASAMGMRQELSVDYSSLPLTRGTTLLLMTDGVHEHIDGSVVDRALASHSHDLDAAAREIVRAALEAGSSDNSSLQIVRVEDLPTQSASPDLIYGALELPLPDRPSEDDEFDGYKILRCLHENHRSYVFLARDLESGETVVLKLPALDLRKDPAALESFLMEGWIAHRIRSRHVVAPREPRRKRKFAYNLLEYVEGPTLRQWMRDHPSPPLERVRDLLEQIARALHAFHRQEMVHHDIRPENIVIDHEGTLKVLDFGSVFIPGVTEMDIAPHSSRHKGSVQYMAPECFLDEVPTPLSDLYSLATIGYELLSGRLPYGTKMAQARTRAQQSRVAYRPLAHDEGALPLWLDEAFQRALQPNPRRRYQLLSEFVYDLRHPSKTFLKKGPPPWLERDPVRFWRSSCLVLSALVLYLLLTR